MECYGATKFFMGASRIVYELETGKGEEGLQQRGIVAG